MPDNKLKVLVADDEPQILEFLAQELNETYRVETADSGSKAWSKLQRNPPDLALLDISMPGLTGFDLCRRIRSHAQLQHLPVIFVTAHTQTETLSRAFDLGGDDFIEKPFRIQEVKARVAAKLRSKAGSRPETVVVGNLRLHPSKMAVTVGGKAVAFSALEFRLLLFFVDRLEKLVTREQILAEVWKGQKVAQRTVDAHIVSLRKRLEDCDHEIVSIYGEGYLFQVRGPASLEQPQ